MRVALYARVSTEEQVRHGISIEAQVAALRTWAETEGHQIAGEYIDEGISARKAPAKRPELQRLLGDLEPLRIELIAFCKLDRWTRNVKGYYQVQDVLDKHKAAWIAIQEDYDTITASGRFKVNIMLSVAENEADRTSERIKSVFEHKIEKGEAITRALPLGLSIKEKRVVPDENAEIVREVFSYFLRSKSKMATEKHISDMYGIRLWILSLDHMLRNTLYKGEYRGNVNYCEPIISQDEFDAVHALLASRDTRINKTGRIYLFSGIVRCAECGHAMTANYQKARNTVYYRCPEALLYNRCNHRRLITEAKLEDTLLAKTIPALEDSAVAWEIENARQQKKPVSGLTREQAEKKIARLKALYIDDLITLEEYKADREKLLSSVAVPAQKAPCIDLAAIHAALDGGQESAYHGMTREQQRELWRSVVREIIVDRENDATIFFK